MEKIVPKRCRPWFPGLFSYRVSLAGTEWMRGVGEVRVTFKNEDHECNEQIDSVMIKASSTTTDTFVFRVFSFPMISDIVGTDALQSWILLNSAIHLIWEKADHHRGCLEFRRKL